MTRDDGRGLLGSLELPANLKSLTVAQLPSLAAELRGRLSHNLTASANDPMAGPAALELAIALHYVFDTTADRIVWQGEGAGGSAIGAALGMAVAAARRGEPRRFVAVIGERALTAGMAFEALNHAGALPADMLVILEDSDPAHSAKRSALSDQLARVLSGPLYAQLRAGSKRVLGPMPTVRELARRSEQHLKGMVLPGTIFEELGFNYIGPVDGHNIAVLVATLSNLKRLHGPQLLHVLTCRAAPTAAAPVRPSVTAPEPPGPRAVPLGVGAQAGRTAGYGEVFAQWLCDIAATDPAILLVTPTMHAGLREFAARFPERCFDVSSAEQHALTFAAGLAAEGLKPVVAFSSTALQRAYDQLIHDAALQRLPLVLAVDHAGLVGESDAPHHGAYDLSYLRCIPNMTIMAPADENECRQMLYTASRLPGPAAVRYPCGTGPGVAAAAAVSPLPLGRARVCREGRSGLALLVFGALLHAATGAAEMLDATLVNMRFVKPLDAELLTALCVRHRALVTIEDNVTPGGAGAGVAEWLVQGAPGLPLLQLGIPERFGGRGSRESCLAAARLDASGLLDSIERWWSSQNPELLRAAAGQ
ncbi:MAG TPA: 1-deoxy-D-xylulose-5-phosphate synthase [Steroidobacteraceae bacterium]